MTSPCIGALRLVRTGNTPLIHTTPGGVRAFHASASTLGKKGMSKQATAKAGKKSVGFKKKGMADSGSSGPRRIETGGLVKLDHPLFQMQGSPATLPEFKPTSLTSLAIGKAIAFPTSKTSVQHIFGVPGNLKQELVQLGQPFSVIRPSTIDLLDKLDKSLSQPSDKTRLVLTGDSGSGKSILLLQAVNYCALNNWIVMYVPEAINWVNSTSPYQYDYRSQTFHQYAIAADMLQKLVEFNASMLSDLTLSENVPIPGGRAGATFKAGSPLETVARHGIKEPVHAPQTLTLLLEQLNKQTKYPVLLAVDDFQALYAVSEYRDPSFNRMHAYNLSMPRLVLEYANGRRKFARGAIVGALSSTHTTFPVRPELKEALGVKTFDGGATSAIDPYTHQAKAVKDFAKGLQAMQVPSGLSLEEAASLVDVWRDNKMVHSTLNDSFFLAKYAETGGNPRELTKKGIWSTLQS